MTKYYKYNPAGCDNTATYIACKTDDQCQTIEREMEGMQDKIPSGTFGWSSDKIAGAPGVAVQFDDREFALPGHYANA